MNGQLSRHSWFLINHPDAASFPLAGEKHAARVSNLTLAYLKSKRFLPKDLFILVNFFCGLHFRKWAKKKGNSS
jgi:hypothetical protein